MAAWDWDWALDRKPAIDAARHRQRLAEAIRAHLATLAVAEIWTAGEPAGTVRIPQEWLKEPAFRYRDGEERETSLPPGPRAEEGLVRPGLGAGEAVWDVEIDAAEVEAVALAELGLPWLRARGAALIPAASVTFEGLATTGPWSRLDRRRSLREAWIRQARTGLGGPVRLRPPDLRFRRWADAEAPRHQAVVIAMRDVSGSMGDFKKRMVRLFSHWMLRFLRSRYEAVETVFLVHHAQAREVGEEEFFHLGESGGTRVSAVYALCREVIRTRYPPWAWNLYPLHFSDGDNWSEADNRRARDLVREMLPWVNRFGYAEIREQRSPSQLMRHLTALADPRLAAVAIARETDLWPALRTMFPRGLESAEDR
ncbi:MAG: DUF444 family protein [Firmicutes bacterium]|nr:DUF444 family protein [Alicyclobacillaceae bacterium]MCL6496836.1 DUF444 family protein [Bacillota bacterium]